MAINVWVAYATSEVQVEIPIEIDEAATLRDAIEASGLLERFPDIPFPDIKVGIYAQSAALGDSLSNGDRIEIYRSLLIDPKDARRLRQQ